MSYRENAKPAEEIFPPTFAQKHPGLVRFGAWSRDWFVGMIFVGAVLVLFPGLYYLGGWFGNSIMYWNLKDIMDGPQRWAVGLAMVLVPFVVTLGPVYLGRRLTREFKEP